MFGTMVLVLMGCGVAVSLGCNNENPSTVIGTAMAFGLSVVAMAYTIGGISGCHINPAITLGVFVPFRQNERQGRSRLHGCTGHRRLHWVNITLPADNECRFKWHGSQRFTRCRRDCFGRSAGRDYLYLRLCFSRFGQDRKSTRLNSSHIQKSRMPSSA